MADRELPSPELLRKLLRYEPETGKLFWLPRDLEYFKDARSWKNWNTKFAGEEALTAIYRGGYRHGTFLNQKTIAHRVIWAMQTGEWPKDQIDHVDRNPSNNVWTNLRAASALENTANCAAHKNGSSKFRGVGWDKRKGKWVSRIQKNKTSKHIGYFDCEIEAAKAYDAIAQEVNREFAGINFPAPNQHGDLL